MISSKTAEKKEENDPDKDADIDNQESSESNPIISERHVGSDVMKKLENAAEQAQRFIKEVEQAIEKRKSTLAILRDIADELDSTTKSVDIARVAGSSVAVVGGATAIAGGILSIFTLGLASPLIGAGVMAAVTGGVTAGGAEIAKAVISKDKMKKAQEVLDEDKKAMTKADEEYDKTKDLAEKISKCCPQLGSPEQIICRLIVINKVKISLQGDNPSYRLAGSSVARLALVVTSLTLAKIASKDASKLVVEIGPKLMPSLLPRLTIVVTKGAVGTAGRSVAKSVLRGATAIAMPVMLAFDIYELVNASMSINNGSKSDAAQTIRDIAGELERQLEDTKNLFAEGSSIAAGLEKIPKEEFTKLMEKITSEDGVSDEDIDMVFHYL